MKQWFLFQYCCHVLLVSRRGQQESKSVAILSYLSLTELNSGMSALSYLSNMPQTTGNESFSSQRIFRGKGISKCCLFPLVFWYNLFLMLRLDTRNPIPALPKHTSHLLQTTCQLCVKLPAANLLLTYIFHYRKTKERKKKRNGTEWENWTRTYRFLYHWYQSSAHYLNAFSGNLWIS